MDGSRGWRTTAGRKSIDQTYGTINWTQDDGDVSKAGDEKCVAYTYNRNIAKNLVTLISRTTTTALTCGTAPSTVDDVISDGRTYFDGATSLTAVPKYGSATKNEELDDWTAASGTVWQTVSQNTYDSTGRVKTSTDIKGGVTETTYTPAVGGPVLTVSTKNPMGWPASVTSDPYWGLERQETDANGKLTTDIDYDALGRVVRVWQLGWSRAANPAKPVAQYEYSFAANRDAYPYVKSQMLNEDGNYVTSYQILDALMRPRQSQTISQGGDGDRVVTDTIYDEFGRAATTYGAHAEPGAPSGTLWWEPEWSVPSVSRTVYDRAGRVTDAVFLSGDGVTNLVEKWRTTTAYEGDLTKVTPPRGGTPTTTVKDAQDRVVALRQHTTAAGVGGAYRETKYTYNRKGQQDKVVDTAGNEWTNTYDAEGRLIRSTDPDKGAITTAFNQYGEVESTSDARGEKIFYTYDAIGRKRTERDDSDSGALRAEWRYDSTYGGQTGFRGQLTQSIRYEPAGSANAYKWQVRTFNERYQPTGVNYVIPPAETGLDGTYVYAYGYSAVTGTQTSISYPAAGGLVTEQVTTDYDATTGMPVKLDTSLTGSAGTMATASYTAYGERSGSIYKMPGGNWAQELTYRDEGTRRITRTTVGRETVAGTISDRNYAYDEAGNILSVEDKPQVGAAEKQCFRSDALGRLTTAWTPRPEVNCQTTDPNLTDLAGPAPYWTDWTFDNADNRTSETSHATAGNTVRSYGVPDKTHQLNSMTTTAPGQAATTTRYGFDLSGNMTCRPAVGSTSNDCDTKANSQTLNWDAEGELATVTVGGSTIESNAYDAEGTRLVRRDATGTTIYLPNQEIRKEGSIVTGTRYYTLGGTVCASRRGSSAVTDLTWLFNDHQGTQQLAVNAGTQAVTIRRQTPYGAPRGATTAWVNQKGFVGGDNDPTGLVNIGARQYDPVLGRFISVDPVMNLADPNQWNAYAYANSSPITHSDPTGLEPRPWHNPNYDPADCANSTSMECHPYGQDEKIAESDARSRERDRAEAQARAEAEAERERKRKECEASFWCRANNTAKAVVGGTMDYLAEHSSVVGVIAGVAVGATCTIVTGGSGAVLCGGLGGMVNSLVNDGLKCYGGEADRCSAGTLIGNAALSGLTGAAFGGLIPGGSAIVRSVGSRSLSALKTFGREQFIQAPKQLARTRGFRISSFENIMDDAAAGPGLKAVLKETLGWAWKESKTKANYASTVAGALAPTTPDDWGGLMENGIELHPVSTPVQAAGAFFGGMWP